MEIINYADNNSSIALCTEVGFKTYSKILYDTNSFYKNYYDPSARKLKSSRCHMYTLEALVAHTWYNYLYSSIQIDFSLFKLKK